MKEQKKDRKVLSSLWLAEEGKKKRKKKSWLAVRKRTLRKKNNCLLEFRFLG